MAATISSYSNNSEKLARFINITNNKMGIPLKPSDVNESNLQFKANKKGEITFALNGIKGVGDSAAGYIVEEREKNGEFVSFYDFVSRMKNYSLTKASIEALIKTDAFRFTGINRNTLLEAYPTLNDIAANAYKNKRNGRKSIFRLFDDRIGEKLSIPEMKEIPDDNDKIDKWEKAHLSMYVTNDPLRDYKNYMNDPRIVTPDLLEEKFNRGAFGFSRGDKVYILAIVGEYSPITTKNNKKLAKSTLDSKNVSVPYIAFDSFLKSANSKILQQSFSPALIKGIINETSDNLEIIINDICDVRPDIYFSETGASYLDEIPPNFELSNQGAKQKVITGKTQKKTGNLDVATRPKGVYICLDVKTEFKSVLNLLTQNQGMSDVYVFNRNNPQDGGVKLNLTVNNNQELRESLAKMIGITNVHIEM